MACLPLYPIFTGGGKGMLLIGLGQRCGTVLSVSSAALCGLPCCPYWCFLLLSSGASSVLLCLIFLFLPLPLPLPLLGLLAQHSSDP